MLRSRGSTIAVGVALLVGGVAEEVGAIRRLWYAQRLPEINDALLEILDGAPSAEALASLVRAEVERSDVEVRDHVVEFLRELERDAPRLHPESVARLGLRLAIAG
ncbi:MAG: hypothetical protein H6712_18995 [Myxococcales bacterium]|nr:hypothetical protein [Myxococcales bacterium]MCB9715962.1 hypothetical protein [Myxococcales bacterium]